MFFNIVSHRRDMSPENLMSIEPEVLAKLILHKRERLVENLPEVVAKVGEQKQIAENLARRSRLVKEDLDAKAINLRTERNSLLTEMVKLLTSQEIDDSNPNHIKILARINNTDTENLDFSEFNEILEICQAENLEGYNNPTIKSKIEASIKANNALRDLSSEHLKAKNKWNEDESYRRQIESKFAKLSSSVRDSNLAVDFWSEKLSEGFEELLIDADRVSKGGPSSRQINRNIRNNPKSRGS